MMKAFYSILSLAIMLVSTSGVNAQLCPGGGLNFASAVSFDSTWTNGCSSGTSCNGGAALDNRAACEPTTTIDPCSTAPLPTCTTTPNASDIWFKFTAVATTATINVMQNVAFFIVVQAFSGGPACGILTDIGCIKSAGPSSGATLNLAGLTIGQKYYFRIFGSAIPISQRTGVYCFCGSIGLNMPVPLPVELLSFNANCENEKVIIDWTTASEINNDYFTLERSTDAINYQTIGTVDGAGNSNQTINYSFTDEDPLPGISYYRLKQTDFDGNFEYFTPATVTCNNSMQGINIYPNPTSNGKFTVAGTETNADLFITNSIGETVFETKLSSDKTEVELSNQPGGLYFVHINSANKNTTKKIIFSQ